MASSSEDDRPVATPRQLKPVPKPRTKLHEDVLNTISFSSPLELRSKTVKIVSENRTDSCYENAVVLPPPPPPNYPPPPLPSEETYDLPKPITYSPRSLSSDWPPKSSESKESPRVVSLEYENFTPVYRLSQTINSLSTESSSNSGDSVKRSPIDSVLFHFDPIYQNIFVDDEKCDDSLEAIFGFKKNDEDIKHDYEVVDKPSHENNSKEEAEKSEDNTVWYDIPETIEEGPPERPVSQEVAPPPPVRMDSIPRENMRNIPSTIIGGGEFNPPIVPELRVKERRPTKLGKFASITRNILTKSTQGVVHRSHFPRPDFGPVDKSVHFSGLLAHPGRDKTEWKVKLSNGIFKWSSEKTEHEVKLQDVTNVAAFTNAATSAVSICFEIVWCGNKAQSQAFLCQNLDQRSDWMHHLLMAMAPTFEYHQTKDFTVAGWLYIKEGVSGSWVGCWMCIKDRDLYYCVDPYTRHHADLRKARRILSQSSGGSDDTFGDCVLLELQGRTLYFQGPSQRDTSRWTHRIKTAALENGAPLEQKQLTKDNVPVLVEECIKFIWQHGSVSEGIYRRSGTVSVISRLLADFNRDAWSVQLTRSNFSEHDVASALKRFFKDLPEPLIPRNLSPSLCKVALAVSETSKEDRVRKYQKLIKKLPQVRLATSRRLFSHLHFLQRKCDVNLMNASNLASIWGVTLMHQQPLELLGEGQTLVASDLISLYPEIYGVTEEEISREMQLLSLLEKLHSGPPKPLPSGDLKVFIHLNTLNSSSDTAQVTVTPQRTVADVCEELGRGSDLVLQEFVMGGALRRPLLPTEKVFEVVIRWGYWDEADRKDNKLVLSQCPFFKQLKDYAKPPLAACNELKFADNRTKHFKVFVFELSQAKLCYYKDRKFSTKVSEWNIEDILWYIGCEPKKEPPTSWSITFVSRHNKAKRSKDVPYFGNTLSIGTHDEMLHWCAAMVLAEHPHGLP